MKSAIILYACEELHTQEKIKIIIDESPKVNDRLIAHHSTKVITAQSFLITLLLLHLY